MADLYLTTPEHRKKVNGFVGHPKSYAMDRYTDFNTVRKSNVFMGGISLPVVTDFL